MKMIYTHENLLLVTNVKNILETHGVEVMLKNEFAQGAIGEISAFDAWPELWLVNDSDFPDAVAIIEKNSSHQGAADWICNHCLESNAASFEICWNCQRECC